MICKMLRLVESSKFIKWFLDLYLWMLENFVTYFEGRRQIKPKTNKQTMKNLGKTLIGKCEKLTINRRR